MAEQDYNDLLKRAREELPEKVIAHERFKMMFS
jgi:hypothetical protein